MVVADAAVVADEFARVWDCSAAGIWLGSVHRTHVSVYGAPCWPVDW